MRNKTIAGVLATAALCAFSASGAFADLTLVGHQNIPNSFVLNFNAVVNSGQTQTPPFTNIKLIFGGNVNYTVSGFNYSMSNAQLFEQVVGGGSPHAVVDGFSGNGAGGWVQTFPTVGAPAGTSTWNFGSAAGNLVTSTAFGAPNNNNNTLNFNVNFAGLESDGTHFYLEFWNGNSFATGYEVKFKVGSTDGNTSRTGYEQVQYFSAVPLPPAVWSGLAMMAGLGVFLAKRRRDRKVLS